MQIGIWTFPLSQMALEQLPLIKSRPGQLPSGLLPSGQLSRNIFPWKTTPGQLPPMKFPQDNYTPEVVRNNSPWIYTHRKSPYETPLKAIALWTFAPRTFFPSLISPLTTVRGQLPLHEILLGQVPTDFFPGQLPLNDL